MSPLDCGKVSLRGTTLTGNYDDLIDKSIKCNPLNCLEHLIFSSQDDGGIEMSLDFDLSYPEGSGDGSGDGYGQGSADGVSVDELNSLIAIVEDVGGAKVDKPTKIDSPRYD